MDQFYTNQDVAESCMKLLKTKIKMEEYDILFEPSAGQGSFLKLMDKDKRIGIDLDPKLPEIKKQNFFDYIPIKNKKYATIGNPPFGRVCSTAIKFFNKCAEFSNCIAFIIPRTFKRVSIQNKLDLNFELIHSHDLPLNPCCFTPKMSAKCCFQIWIRSATKRKKVKYDSSHKDFQFMKHGPKDKNNQPTPPNNADFALKAYGSNCGEIKTDNLDKLRPKSWHWIKSNIDKKTLINRFSQLDYSMSKDTVRQDSLGQKELVYLYKLKFG